jgi:hypothetical protein
MPKRVRPAPGAAASAASSSAKRKRTLAGLSAGGLTNLYADVLPKSAIIHRRILLPRDKVDGPGAIIFSGAAGYNEIIRWVVTVQSYDARAGVTRLPLSGSLTIPSPCCLS